MTTVTITRQTHVAMLKHLVAGKDLEFVAAATRVPRDTVLDIVSRHGYPAVDKMAWAIDILIKEQDKLPERAPTNPRSVVFLDEIPARPTARVGNSATRVNGSSGFALIQPATGQPATNATDEPLLLASRSVQARTRNLGKKISALLIDLDARLAVEKEAREATVKADKAAAVVAARIAELEAELAQLKGKPKTTGKSKATRPVITGEYSCTHPDCGRVFDKSQGVALHQRRAHEGWNPRTVNAA
jgi:hypothetical protein